MEVDSPYLLKKKNDWYRHEIIVSILFRVKRSRYNFFFNFCALIYTTATMHLVKETKKLTLM